MKNNILKCSPKGEGVNPIPLNYIKENVEHYINLIQEIRRKSEGLININPIYEISGTKHIPSAQTFSLEKDAQDKHIQEVYKNFIKELNLFLLSINKEPLKFEVLQNVMQELHNVQLEVDNQYSWFFENEPKDIRNWMERIGITKVLPEYFQGKKIPDFKDAKGNKHQLTPKAVIASSFLSKAGLLNNDNINILDVGFRNNEKFGSLWNSFTTGIMKPKSNQLAWFQEQGEVDYIAYIEKDTSLLRKDKLVIVFSGSNSQMDWGINLTIGHNAFLGLSLHEGIGWLFNTSINTYHSVLMDRIQDYYKRHQKPKNLEVITVGHSLGGGLAELAAYYYKTKQLEMFKNIVAPDKISVKTFTFAAPAIVDKSSKEVIENALGKNNIYRVWVANDPVVTWTDNSRIQGGVHIGKSLPLYNIQNLASNVYDWWGPHGADRYISYLHTLRQENQPTQYKNLISVLNNYIKSTHLDIYKRNLKALLPIIEAFKSENIPDTFNLSQDLAEHIINYSPTTFEILPYKTIGEIPPHSPRYVTTSHEYFEVEYESQQINAKFKIQGREIDFPISPKTECSIIKMREFLEGLGLKITDESAEKLSCGCFLAKLIFICHPQATLEEMLFQCVEKKSCSLEYLKNISKGKSLLEQAMMTLGEVGLRDIFLWR